MSETSLKREYLPIIILILITVGFSLFLNIGLRFFLNTSTPQVAVTTGSMMPTYNGYLDNEVDGPYQDFLGIRIPQYIFRGDILIIKNVSSSNIKVGDVIVFNANRDQPIVHRIVKKRELSDSPGHFEYLTKGDNNHITDADNFGWISEKDIFGKVILRIPKLGWLSLQLQTLTGRLAIIFVAVVLLFSSFMEEDENQNDKEQENPSKESEKQSNTQQSSKTSELSISNLSKIIKGDVFGKRSLYMISALGFIFITLFFNAAIAVTGNCEVSFLYRDTNAVPTSLDCEGRFNEVENITSGKSAPYYNDYLVNVRYSIQSAGLFNHVKQIEVSTNTSTSSYRWTVVYSFCGEKIINGVVPISVPKNISHSIIDVQISMFTQGIFSSVTPTKHYLVQFKQF